MNYGMKLIKIDRVDDPERLCRVVGLVFQCYVYDRMTFVGFMACLN